MTAPVLIFGATGGIGAALARMLARDGTPLFLTARSEEKLESLAGELDQPFRAGDVLDEGDIEAIVSEAAEDGLAGLVFAVGSIVLQPLKRSAREDFLDAYRLNALAPALAVKNAAPALKKDGGAVVLFSTIAVQSGFANHAVISSAKGAVEGLTRALAAELAPDIRVNAVAPSLTDTPLAEKLTSNETMAKALADMHPIPRLGAPEDAAAAARYLLSEDASWVSGQVVAVDGGRGRLRVKG